MGMGITQVAEEQLRREAPQPSSTVSTPPPVPFVQTQPLADASKSWNTGKGKGQGNYGNITYPGQGRQPAFGKRNIYSNTIGSWDNSDDGTSTQSDSNGKGKGA